eukprot:m.1388571 g.1388571  ORF g.1388571 m.1388571 type:complete len:242 (-) comp24987_c0_seq25:3618-4343(-)
MGDTLLNAEMDGATSGVPLNGACVAELFRRASEFARDGLKNATTAERLQLYAWFKQSTTGDCNINRPGIFSMEGRAKWDAWNRVKGTPQEIASLRYVEFVTTLAPTWTKLLLADERGASGHGNESSDDDSSDEGSDGSDGSGSSDDPTGASLPHAQTERMAMGPVQSTLYADHVELVDHEKTIFDFVKDGDAARLAAMFSEASEERRQSMARSQDADVRESLCPFSCSSNRNELLQRCYTC